MLKKKQNTNYDRMNTLIGRDVVIEGGSLTSTETVRIDGTYIGQISCQGNLLIGETGLIKGDIIAQNILVNGKIEGNISASEEVHLATTCEVIGDISYANFIVDEGAKFTGNCKTVMNHSSQVTIDKPKPQAQLTAKKDDKNKK